MTTRTAFELELQALEDQLRAMTERVGTALRRANQSLVDADPVLAQAVIEEDEAINHQWALVEREIIEIIARQQPLASDLREIMAISAIVTDLERIGDHAKSIARGVLKIVEDPPLQALVDIPRMAGLCVELLERQIAAFLSRDGDTARTIAARDEELDTLYRKVYGDHIAAMRQDPSVVRRDSTLISIAKSMERVGDHVTNIGEWVVFLQTGKLVELND